jgi:hypothetical protein
LKDQNLKCKEAIPAPETDPDKVFYITSNHKCPGRHMTHDDEPSTGAGCPDSPYILVRTYTLNDDDPVSPAVTCTQKFTVKDDVPPTLTPPPAPATYQCTNLVPPAPTLPATDNCPGTVTVSSSDSTPVPLPGAPSECTNKYSFDRTWTARDICGNTNSTNQKITVSDTTPPSISCGPDISVNICTEQVPSAPTGTVKDNCDADRTVSPAACCFSGAGVKRTYTASDSCGNPAPACFQNVLFEPACV